MAEWLEAGKAVPQVIGRHAHPKAPPDKDDPHPAALTGIDYLKLVADADQAALSGQLSLSVLDDSDPAPPPQPGGQDQDEEGSR